MMHQDDVKSYIKSYITFHIKSNVRVTFWSCHGHFSMIFGIGWDMFGDTLGVVWDGLVMIFGKCSKNPQKQKCLELSGSNFPVADCLKQSLLAYSGETIKKKIA